MLLFIYYFYSFITLFIIVMFIVCLLTCFISCRVSNWVITAAALDGDDNVFDGTNAGECINFWVPGDAICGAGNTVPNEYA